MRVRFCPSPTGSPHVGLARTALFNWAFARHHGGTFVFRIEDTDAARDSEESYDTLLEVMRWLGFDWDEGPEVGGPHAPYRQSERGDIYADVLLRLREAGRTYDCYCTNEEVEARRKASGSKLMGYDGFCRELTRRAGGGVRAAETPVGRFRMPDGELTFDDLVRGEITFHTRPRARLRRLPRQRPAALHPGQPGRRRADGDHPRAARRGPAVQHPAAARAVRRARADRRREGDCRASATCPT